MDFKKDESHYNMIDWWKKVVFENYANFQGRARRSEYWYFVLANFLLTILILLPSLILFGGFSENDFGGIFLLPITFYFLLMLLPTVAVSVRRLHDTGKSGWLYLLTIIPIVNAVGGIILLVFYFLESDTFTNEYGPNPKGTVIDDSDLEVRF